MDLNPIFHKQRDQVSEPAPAHASIVVRNVNGARQDHGGRVTKKSAARPLDVEFVQRPNLQHRREYE
eukprot:839226-Rhodomonas_salina.2